MRFVDPIYGSKFHFIFGVMTKLTSSFWSGYDYNVTVPQATTVHSFAEEFPPPPKYLGGLAPPPPPPPPPPLGYHQVMNKLTITSTRLL